MIVPFSKARKRKYKEENIWGQNIEFIFYLFYLGHQHRKEYMGIEVGREVD